MKLKSSLLLLSLLALSASQSSSKGDDGRSLAAAQPAAGKSTAPVKSAEEEVQSLLDQYFAPNTSALKRTAGLLPRILDLTFIVGDNQDRYLSVMEVVKNHPGIKSDSGTELTVFMQTVWEQRFGAEIRANTRDTRWGREGVMWSGTLFGTIAGLRYFKGKIGLIANIGRRLVPYLGIGITHQVASIYNPKRANGTPPSPFEILGFGDTRPEDHGWESRDLLAWNMVEVVSAVGVMNVGRSAANRIGGAIVGRFSERKNCLEGAEMILSQYSYRQDAIKILGDFKTAGVASFKTLWNWIRRRTVDVPALKSTWGEAFNLSEAEIQGFKNHWSDYIKHGGPAGLVGALAAGIAVQVALDETSERLSVKGLKEEIAKSIERLGYYQDNQMFSEVEVEGYRFRRLIEHYSDSIMFEITERTEEQLYQTIMGSGEEGSANADERNKINAAIRKTYTQESWSIFETRIQAFLEAGKEYPDLMIPGLYREVSTDGLPSDPGNALLYGAVILHKHKLNNEFQKLFEKIANTYGMYKANRVGNEAKEVANEKN